MMPTQAPLWQFLGLPHWHCAHPERLPLAPLAPAEVMIVVDALTSLPVQLVQDLSLALSLDKSQLSIISQADWLSTEQPKARVLLGINISCDTQAFHWHGNWPLSSIQKRALWSTLCRCYLDH